MIRYVRERVNEDGVGVLELLVSMMVTAVIAAIMLSWVVSVGRINNDQDAEDLSLQELRIAKEHLTKELRHSEYLTVATATTMTMWVDEDDDETFDTGELVTWNISGTDGLQRWTDASSPITRVAGIDAVKSVFAYDSATAADVTNVTIDLVVQVPKGNTTVERSIGTEIHLRNV